MSVGAGDGSPIASPAMSPSLPSGNSGPDGPSPTGGETKALAKTPDPAPVPEVNVNGEPVRSPRPSVSFNGAEGDETWGSNFWVTLADPQTSTLFFACPATGQVSWDPPVGTFVLPPNPEGEWWELSDESRGGIPYYYQTKSGETVWERPEGFVIPLGIIQQTALGRRLSQTGMRNKPLNGQNAQEPPDRPGYRRSRSYTADKEARHVSLRPGETEPARTRPSFSSTRSSPGRVPNPGTSPIKQPTAVRRSFTNDQSAQLTPSRSWSNGHHLPPIPGSPYSTEPSTPPSPAPPSPTPMSRKSLSSTPANGNSSPKDKEKRAAGSRSDTEDASLSRSRSKSSSYVPYRSPAPQSLNAAVEMLSLSDRRSTSDHGHPPPMQARPSQSSGDSRPRPSMTRTTPTKDKSSQKRDIPQSPSKHMAVPQSGGGFWMARSASTPPTVAGKIISSPILNQEATLNMSPVKNRAAGKPIPINSRPNPPHSPTATLASGTYPMLPHDLASDIQQFVESDFARQYFSTHRTGFIFRRKVPVAQMMTWQKAPLNSPLLTVTRSLKQDAVKIFKVIQHIMGDRERDKSLNVRVHADAPVAAFNNGSTTSLTGSSVGLLEEERWLLGEGLTHGELRDEIYCQLMKQLSGNPNAESVFKGWQMLCVLLITFPPSKNFETYLRSFMQQRTTQQEGRVDVMAKHCLRRLVAISKKGPRGKPPSMAEIETAADAAFNPSTFGESLDATMRLQERNYPREKIPIILPFLADGILALGGTKSEGIFRVPGDGDSVSELKLRIDRGYYNLDSVSDPNVLASLLKLWLRELCDPLVPEEMYNDCITHSRDPDACVRLVRRLPTINRRVVLFVISFLQLFLEEKVQGVTKMTSANIALVMAPNLLRCNSDSMAIVFTNAQYEQVFVYNLLLHLRCNEIDEDYVPVHGLGASPPSSPKPRASKSRNRR
ncbi:RhoGAP-domain-containing protein [Leucogyrophana mollusca]|uniref:RhoGAP-domain-containing protein n=1 Tax=Leucogyrophana mollusca TaxID=85980 RepID=A0ACB8B4H9_9AGAM|nr:RhoGAP-domain-containing protein [Leucogyrophana mollusca]